MSFPFFPWKNGEKSIWKEREKYSFPSFFIYFFPIFSMGTNGKRQIFLMGKNGVELPTPCFVHGTPTTEETFSCSMNDNSSDLCLDYKTRC